MKNKSKQLSIILIMCCITLLAVGVGLYTAFIETVYAYIEDYRIISSATLDDNFADDRVVVVLTRMASRNFGEFTPNDFPEFAFANVRCITPGLDLAKAQIQAQNSNRLSMYYYDPSWSVNLDEFRRILVLTLAEPSKQNVLDAINALSQRLDVRSTEPSFYWEPEPCYEDYSYYENYTDIAPLSSSPWWHTNINLPQAHNISTGSSSLLVGVISNGVQRSHPSFNIYNRLSKNFCVRDNLNHYVDSTGHGTRVSGIIAGQIGIAPNARLVSLRIGARYWSDAMIDAINYAAYHRIPILNISSSPPRTRIDVLDAIRNFPGLVVVSAGNRGVNMDTYEDYDGLLPENNRPTNLIITGSVDSRDRRSNHIGWSSNFGDRTVCIFAPGSSIRTTNNNGWYTNVSGTSFAVPHVVGTAALMLSVNPNLSGVYLRNAIINNAEEIAITVPTIAEPQIVRRLNAYAAVSSVAPFITRNRGSMEIEITGLRHTHLTTLFMPPHINNRIVTSIAPSAFFNTSLTSVVLPPTIAYIGDGAFFSNNLTSLTLPSTVIHIGIGAFGQNPNLQSVTIMRPITQGITTSGLGSFHSTHHSLQIFVPTKACAAAYRDAPNWNTYRNRIHAFFSITVDPTGVFFPTMIEGQTLPAVQNTRVYNTGNQPTGVLSITADNNNFIFPTTIASIPVGGFSYIAISPSSNLSAGSHATILTVMGNNGISQSFVAWVFVEPYAMGITVTPKELFFASMIEGAILPVSQAVFLDNPWGLPLIISPGNNNFAIMPFWCFVNYSIGWGISPVSWLLAGEHITVFTVIRTDTNEVLGAFTARITVYPRVWEIELCSISHEFDSIYKGDPLPFGHTFTVTNTGNQATGWMSIYFNQTYFMGYVSSIPVGGYREITIIPSSGLKAGIHTYVFTIVGNNGVFAVFSVSITVKQATPDYDLRFVCGRVGC